MNRLENTVLQTALLPNSNQVADFQGTGVAVSELQDMVKIIMMVRSVSGAGRTMDIAIEDAAVLGGPYTALSPAVAFAQVGLTDSEQELNLYIEGVREFIRVNGTILGTTPVFEVGVVFLGRTGQQ